MDAGAIRAYCLSKPGTYEDSPFGGEPACFRMRGYHNTVSYDCMEDGALKEMMDHAYERVLSRLPGALRRELSGEG